MRLIADCLWQTTKEGRKARSHLMWEVESKEDAAVIIDQIGDIMCSGAKVIVLPGNSQILSSIIRTEDLRMMTFRLVEED